MGLWPPHLRPVGASARQTSGWESWMIFLFSVDLGWMRHRAMAVAKMRRQPRHSEAGLRAGQTHIAPSCWARTRKAMMQARAPPMSHRAANGTL